MCINRLTGDLDRSQVTMKTSFAPIIWPLSLLHVMSLLVLLGLFSSYALGDSVVLSDQRSVEVQPYLTKIPPGLVAPNSSIDTISVSEDFAAIKNNAIDANNQDLWYRFSVTNRSEETRWVLDFSELLFDEIEVFYTEKGSWKSYNTGLKYPFDSRPIESLYYAFPLEIATGETQDIFFRINTMHQPLVFPVLYKDNHYVHYASINSGLSLLNLGFLTGILVFTSVIILSSGENKRLMIFALVILSVMSNTIYSSGLFFSVLPDFYEFHRSLYNYILCMTNIAFLLFCRELWVLSERRPMHDKILKGYMSVFVLAFVLNAWLGPERLIQFMALGSLITMIILFITGLDALRDKLPSAKLYLIGLLFFLIPTIYNVFSSFGLVEYSLWSRHGHELGTLFLGFFLSLVVGKQIYATKKSHDDLVNKNKIIKTRDQLKSEFLAAMSHEIRTPINGVLGMAQLLQQTKQNDTQVQYTDIIINSGKTLLAVINDILDLSKVEAGKLVLVEEDVDLSQMVVYASALFYSTLNKRNLRYIYEVSEDAPIYLLADSTRLQQLITNLLNNASKFTSEGSVAFYIEKRKDLTEDSVLMRFSVIDTGCGISQEMQEDIFKPYTQEQHSSARSYDSTGLGLAICKRFVEHMGGSIHVKSTLGEGSHFWFDIPIKINVEKQQRYESECRELIGKRIFLANMPTQHAESTALHFRYWQMDVSICSFKNLSTEHFKDQDIALVLYRRGGLDMESIIESAMQYDTKLIILLTPGSDEFFLKKEHRDYVQLLQVPLSVSTLQKAIYGMLIRGETKRKTESTRVEDNSLAGTRVMVAEDNVVNQKVVFAMLEKLGCTVTLFDNGQTASEAFFLAADDVDLIIMDCEMPVMDGYTATQAIRQFEVKQARQQTIPIIALTAHALPVNQIRCLDVGMTTVLTKPIDFDELKSTLTEALE